MYEYGQYCPVARASEILADRWTPLIVRELLAGIRRFNDLDRGLPGISRALLVERLRRLERVHIVERRAERDGRGVEYDLTRAGRQLQRVIDVLGGWGARWAFGDPRPTELDPVVLLWWMKRRVYRHRLPTRRVVIQFDFSGRRTGSYWLVLERADVSVCLQHPKFDIDVRVAADIDAFYRVWLGRITLEGAMRTRRVRLEGMPGALRAFPRWFAWSPMAEAVRGAAASRPPGPAGEDDPIRGRLAWRRKRTDHNEPNRPSLGGRA
jgi:DNA-binding HxlR family transcriptional regulator